MSPTDSTQRKNESQVDYLRRMHAESKPKGAWGGPPADDELTGLDDSLGEATGSTELELALEMPALDAEQQARVAALEVADQLLRTKGLWGSEGRGQLSELTLLAEYVLKGPAGMAENTPVTDDASTDAEDEAPTDGGELTTSQQAVLAEQVRTHLQCDTDIARQ